MEAIDAAISQDARKPRRKDQLIKQAFRDIAASVWTSISLGAVLCGLHVWWFVQSDHKADVISGFGVSLAVLGILVAAQPLINIGIRKTARRQSGLISEDRQRELDEQAHIVEEQAARRVFQEQVCGAGLIAIGTLLNGYAPAIARLFAFPV